MCDVAYQNQIGDFHTHQVLLQYKGINRPSPFSEGRSNIRERLSVSLQSTCDCQYTFLTVTEQTGMAGIDIGGIIQ